MGCLIYGLIDPRSGQLRYVGKTSGSLHRRRLAHLNDVKRGRVYIPRHKWISELLETGLEPEAIEIEIGVTDWQEAEQHWIGYFRSVGCHLLNATAGGDGLHAYRHRPETRAKQAEAARRRYARAGERERTGLAVSQAFSRPEVRMALKAGRKKVSREALQPGIAALVAYAKSAEGRAKTSARSRGRKVSEETRRKISEAATGRRWTDQQRQAQSERRRGRKHTEETKQKIAASSDRTAASERSRARWADPEYRAQQAKVDRSSAVKAMWADPVRRAERLAQQRAKRSA